MNADFRDIIVPSIPAGAPLWLSRDKSKPFGTTGLVSTRPGKGISLTDRKPTAKTPLRPEVSEDPATKLYVVECPGLTLIALRDASDFDRAVRSLLARQKNPRDKGAIVLPLEAHFKVDPVPLRALADNGIVVLRAEVADPQQALRDLAGRFIASSTAALRNIEAFMESDPVPDED